MGWQRELTQQNFLPLGPKINRKHGRRTSTKEDRVERRIGRDVCQLFEQTTAEWIDAVVLIHQAVKVAVMAFVSAERKVGVQAQHLITRR